MGTGVLSLQFDLGVSGQLAEVTVKKVNERLLSHVLTTIVRHLIRHLKGSIDNPHDGDQKNPGDCESQHGLEQQDSPPPSPLHYPRAIIADRVSHSATFRQFSRARSDLHTRCQLPARETSAA